MADLTMADRPCPFCAEMIKAAAIKCKFCGSAITQPGQEPGFWTRLFSRIHWGAVNAKLVCKQCQERGHVRTTRTIEKGLVSKRTKARCDNCRSQWEF